MHETIFLMGCYWDAVGMLLGCCWDAAGMLLGWACKQPTQSPEDTLVVTEGVWGPLVRKDDPRSGSMARRKKLDLPRVASVLMMTMMMVMVMMMIMHDDDDDDDDDAPPGPP